MIDVSVIIPYHQDRGYLFDAIESYEAQEFTGTSELILSLSLSILLLSILCGCLYKLNDNKSK